MPARAAGLRASFLRRGAVGPSLAEDPKVRKLAGWRIASVTELPALIQASGAAR